MLGAVARINEAVESGDAQQTVEALQDPAAHLEAVDESCGQRYLNRLSETKARKEGVSETQDGEGWEIILGEGDGVFPLRKLFFQFKSG